MTQWQTEITSIQKNSILVRGYAIEEIMEKLSFSDTVFLILKGQLPSDGESKVFCAILSSSIDHGVTPPSALATLNAASTGAPLNACVASGILAINRFHGGAVEDAMKLLREAGEYAGPAISKQKVMEFVQKKLGEGTRFSGFGHRVHTADPRSLALSEIAKKYFTDQQLYYIKLIEEMASAVEHYKGTKLPVNVDGMIGAALLSLGFQPELANGIFMISRVPGLIAHFIEERTTQKPMRQINQADAIYTGQSRRSIDK